MLSIAEVVVYVAEARGGSDAAHGASLRLSGASAVFLLTGIASESSRVQRSNDSPEGWR